MIGFTSCDVSESRYIMIARNEFPWAAIIMFFPAWSFGSICIEDILKTLLVDHGDWQATKNK